MIIGRTTSRKRKMKEILVKKHVLHIEPKQATAEERSRRQSQARATIGAAL